MSILRLKKCAIIAVNTIMSIWLIRAILFFGKRMTKKAKNSRFELLF